MKLLQNITAKEALKTSLLSTFILALAISSFSVASAQDTMSPNASSTPRKEFRDARAAIRGEATSTRRNIIQNTRAEVKDLRAAGSSTRREILDANKGKMSSTTRDELRANRASTTDAIQAVREGRRTDLMANRASTTEAISTKKTELLQEIAKRKTDKKKKLVDKSLTAVQDAVGKVYSNLNDKLTRLSKVDASLTSKLNELKNNGTDVTSASALLVTAHTSLAKATVDVQATASLIHDQTATSTSKEILKGLITTARTSVKTAGENYKKVVESIKAYLPKSDEASSTGGVNASSTEGQN